MQNDTELKCGDCTSELEMWHPHLIFPIQHWWVTRNVVPFLNNLLAIPLEDVKTRAGFSPEVFRELLLLQSIALELYGEETFDKWHNADLERK